jgi:hypothetical protein
VRAPRPFLQMQELILVLNDWLMVKHSQLFGFMLLRF